MQSPRNIIIFAVLISTGCNPVAPTDTATEERDRPSTVFASILPTGFFVQRVAGTRFEVEVLLPSGRSPESYEPSGKQLARLSESGVLFSVDMPMESSIVGKTGGALAGLRIIDTTCGLGLSSDVTGEPGISARQHNGHFHIGDPHIWMSPRLAIVQVNTIADGLCEIDSEYCESYRQNARTMIGELAALDRELVDMLKPVAGRTILVFHPAFGHFADAYDLKQLAVEQDGHTPTAKRLERLLDTARTEQVSTLFTTPESTSADASDIAKQLNVPIVTLNPLAADYLDNMRTMAQLIRNALLKQSTSQDGE